MIEQGGRGGVADYTNELVRALAAAGWRVLLATAEDHCYRPSPGVSIHPTFHYVRGHSWLARQVRRYRLGQISNGLRFLLAIPRLMALARRVDIVHSQGWEYAPLGLVALAFVRMTGVPVVQTWHNTFERDRSRDRTHAALRRLTAFTIVHTEADLARVPRAACDRIVVIPHGEYGSLASSGGQADRERVRGELGIDQAAPITLMFGQLRPDKGLDDLLKALVRVPRLHLLIAGQEAGALAAAKAQLRADGLAGRVTVREGFMVMSEAARMFAAADTVVLPYRVASQSGVLLLAYGFRRPVIIYPVGGLVEAVVDGETGWICERADVDALVDALEASIAAGWAECCRRGECGHRLAHERYSWPASAERTAQIYQDVLARRRPFLRLRAG
jgi:glycosyltransferase involved in cell wall biosynthesis